MQNGTRDVSGWIDNAIMGCEMICRLPLEVTKGGIMILKSEHLEVDKPRAPLSYMKVKWDDGSN